MIGALGRAFWRRVARADELVQLRRHLEAEREARIASEAKVAELVRRLASARSWEEVLAMRAQLAASEGARRKHAEENALLVRERDRAHRAIDKALAFGGQIDDWDPLAWATVASILKGEIA